MKTRQQIMRAVKAKDTKPELFVRRLAHGLGYRFRLHRADLPGKPDLVFPSRRKVIFVHGCFWHGHSCKRGNRMPATNQAYWSKKISRNKTRYQQQQVDLNQMGWRILTIWECEIKEKLKAALIEKLVNFLESSSP